MFLPGEVVEVMAWNKEERKMDWGKSYKVRVTHSEYLGGDRNREFVGVVLFGWDAAEGSTLAIQNIHARQYKWGSE
jgi:hypothetical protein